MKTNLNDKLIVAVRVRGRVNVRHDVTETLNRLRLKRVSNCALIKVTPQYMGMLKKATNHIAYGEIDEETLGKLITKFKLNMDPKALISGKSDAKELREKLPLRLHPPRHGYKNVRLHFNQGGTLGYMGKDINKLIKRMV